MPDVSKIYGLELLTGGLAYPKVEKFICSARHKLLIKCDCEKLIARRDANHQQSQHVAPARPNHLSSDHGLPGLQLCAPISAGRAVVMGP